MSGYTRGPLECDRDGFIRQVGDAGPPLAQVGTRGDPDEAVANGFLFAAAPDLLEALEALEMRVRVVVGAHAPELKGARAAIAKARGTE